MKKLWILPIIVVTALLFTVLGIYITKAQKPVQNAVNAPQPISVPLDANKILELVNAERAKVGVAPLVSDPRLVASAQAKADDMVANNYFNHVSPVTGKHGYENIPKGMCVMSSENIQSSPKEGDNNHDAVTWWMNSKPHHDAMLDARYNLTGIGTAYNPKQDRYISVQHFCQTN